MLSQSKLKEILHYNPDTGIFTWKQKVANNVKINDIAGTFSSDKYIVIQVNKHIKKAHRLAFLYMTGKIPVFIDYKDQIRSNNKWNNLTQSDYSHNAKNKSLCKQNKSGFTGIRKKKQNSKWEVSISVNKKYKYLGSFINLSDAVLTRIQAEEKYGFNPNHGQPYNG